MLEEKIKEIITEPLKKEKIDVYKVYFESSEGIKNLVIEIDSKPYVDIDTCVKASHIINPILDEYDLIEESYVLDVCSKGVEE